MITEEELDAYFGILILSGSLHTNKLDIHELWEDKYGMPIAKATMSRERFKAIHTCIRFDDIEMIVEPMIFWRQLERHTITLCLHSGATTKQVPS